MKVIVIGWDLESSKKAVELASYHDFLYATVGFSHYSASEVNENPKLLNKIFRLAQKEKVVAIGETGLDYYRLRTPLSSQQKLFRKHIQLANQLRLPVVVHDREAHDDTIRILVEEEPQYGVLHCFSGDKNMLDKLIDIGFYISISGILTFSNELAQIVKHVPRDKLLVETDSPYLAPVPKRGKRNEPLFITYTMQKIAEVLRIPYEEIVKINATNAMQLFKIGL